MKSVEKCICKVNFGCFFLKILIFSEAEEQIFVLLLKVLLNLSHKKVAKSGFAYKLEA